MNVKKLAISTIKGFFCTQLIPSSLKRCLTCFIGASMLLFVGNAYAVITVGLSIDNDLDSNGNITVINGSKVKVSYAVIEDTDKDLHKNDVIQLLRVSDDSVVDSVKRGKKKNGSAVLKVKNSVDEALYVHYKRKGSAGTVITRTSHPGDPGFTALLSIARASVADLTIDLNALGIGAASVSGGGFHDIRENDGCLLLQTNFHLDYSAGSGCDAFASIQFPDGVTLTSLECSVHDNVATASVNIDVDLIRHDLSTGVAASIFSTNSSVDSASVQTISDTTASSGTVDNSRYAFVLWADFGPASPNGLTLYGCTVRYN